MASLLFNDVAASWFLFLGMSRVKACDICQVLGLIVARKFHWGCVCVRAPLGGHLSGLERGGQGEW